MGFLNDNRRKAFEQSFINSHSGSLYPSGQPQSDKALKVVKFGHYYNENDVDKSPVEWYVLAVENKKVLLTTVYGVDCMPYNVKQNFTT